MNVRATTVRTACVLALVAAAVPASARQSADAPVKKLAPGEPIPRRGYNVVLLLGDMQDVGGPDTVPNAAKKALSDMRDFLPYKSYKLLDTQWVLASSSGPAITRLRGVEEEYVLELRGQPTFVAGGAVSATSTLVRFVLSDASEPTGAKGDSERAAAVKNDADARETGREIFQLERERDELQLMVTELDKQVAVGVKDQETLKRAQSQLALVSNRIRVLKLALSTSAAKTATARAVIDTQFKMEDGETVVVGTSRVKGGSKALIALLTAVGERSKSK